MKKLVTILLICTFSILKAQYVKLFEFGVINVAAINYFNGKLANGSLISDGTFFYGMAQFGGGQGISGNAFNGGTIFKIKPDGTSFVKLRDFGETDATNGYGPSGGLITDGNYLYGMTADGGTGNCNVSSGCGVVFKVKKDGTSYSKLYEFGSTTGQTNGSSPRGELYFDGSSLYGMTSDGGNHGVGVIFKINTDGTGFTKLYDFDIINGARPYGSLITDGTYLYGMTRDGGGTIFKIKKDGTSYTKLFGFNYTNGAYHNGAFPNGALISDGTYLYGMTEYGGNHGVGVIFKINTDGTGFTKLYDFDIIDGARPYGSLITDGNYLYGTTNIGGTNYGTAFKIKPDGTSFSKIWDFVSVDGNSPRGSLLLNGSYLYGTTTNGGSYGGGVVFKLGLLTSINELEKEKLFSIYPNPSKGIFNIKSDYAIFSIEVYNSIGTLISKPELKPTNQIDLSNLSQGMYLLKVSEGKQSHTEKVLIE